MMVSASASASASPSPRSPEITEKTKKYDRQLRLWGDHGQSRLERSQICLINACATGTEILKSLVLPGVGSFTIVDGFKVTQEDVGNNFFLEVESVGKSRAECATKLLMELNPDVNGEAIEDHADNLLKHNPTFFNRFSVVIGCQLSESVLTTISKTLWDNQVPFVYVNCIGFLGWMRIQVNEHTIIESHPDSIIEDLRLDVAFPELVGYINSVTVDNRETALKTPWLVLLYKAIQKYMSPASNGSKDEQMEVAEIHPCHMNGKQKQEFKKFLKQYLTSLGLMDGEEEFDQVVRASNTALTKTSINSHVKAIIDDPKASKPENSKFWVLCGALREFVQANNGQLPVCGVLPDMEADSDKYISLQNVYREKAGKDAEDVLGRCQQLLKQAGLQGITIVEDDVKLFCKECHNLRLIRGYPMHEEINSVPAELLQELAQNTEDANQEMMFYLLLRGLLRFEADFKTYPGLLDGDVEPDITRFKSTITKLLNDWNANISMKEDCIHEICRYGACELPTVAAFMGGCAAQEVIKVVTKQYVPLDNTFIYNAMQSTSISFRISCSSS